MTMRSALANELGGDNFDEVTLRMRGDNTMNSLNSLIKDEENINTLRGLGGYSGMDYSNIINIKQTNTNL
jgi:hypothetical protein